jgi:tetratricopeptide (TPR) repeat protein
MRLYEARGLYADMLYWCAQAVAADPDDHELPSHCAQYLLMMGLVAEAEPWVRRAELVNASGSDTRRVAIQYAEQTGDHERAIALSRDILRERRDNRRFVYGMAAIHYLTLMHEAGKLDEALAFVEKLSPGAGAAELPAAESEMDFVLQIVTATFVAGRETPAQRKTKAATLHAGLRRVNPDAELETDIVGVVLAAIEGDRARASAILVEVFRKTDEVPWEWRLGVLRDPLLGDLVREPAVAAAIADFQARMASEGERYRQMVADGKIKVP